MSEFHIMQKSNSDKKLEKVHPDPEFVSQAKKMEIYTLRDVLGIDVVKLKAHPEFTYTWYAALLEILKQEGLLDEFQQNL